MFTDKHRCFMPQVRIEQKLLESMQQNVSFLPIRKSESRWQLGRTNSTLLRCSKGTFGVVQNADIIERSWCDTRGFDWKDSSWICKKGQIFRNCIVSNQLAKKIEGRRRNEDEFAKLQSLIVHSAKKERRT